MMLAPKPIKVTKVLMCGGKSVGKTTILEQLIHGKVTKDLYPTIEDIYVASVDTGKGTRDQLSIYDTAGLQGSTQQLPRHYISFPDAFILVYDPSDPSSLDILGNLKVDIDRNKEKKEVAFIVLANMRSKSRQMSPNKDPNSTLDPESVLQRANLWCAKERIKHYVVNALERPSLYNPFIDLAIKLHPGQTKTSTFTQLRQKTISNLSA
ncbi:NF-kappa-B inhibitor-interacting Ras-like protein [Culicoides brevitarsis]|uniref:NF-kappa-B inhibitor-interacting Ras-like protein n=1 Tax=Culicoides brevitarsis TaxID=469753 RepID=UPI00307BF780